MVQGQGLVEFVPSAQRDTDAEQAESVQDEEGPDHPHEAREQQADGAELSGEERREPSVEPPCSNEPETQHNLATAVYIPSNDKQEDAGDASEETRSSSPSEGKASQSETSARSSSSATSGDAPQPESQTGQFYTRQTESQNSPLNSARETKDSNSYFPTSGPSEEQPLSSSEVQSGPREEAYDSAAEREEEAAEEGGFQGEEEYLSEEEF